jgi:gamma-glutamylcyclotransferase (GGCT)/AIG2-like uncharacterized protein YtfP
MADVTERRFVYGTLRSDAPRDRASARNAFAMLQAGASPEGRASVEGLLYAPSWYPALVPGAGRVLGEVWLLGDSALPVRLDAYEGEAYAREAVSARLDDGPTVTAWTYRYLGPLAGVPLIPSGDYLDWVRQRK